MRTRIDWVKDGWIQRERDAREANRAFWVHVVAAGLVVLVFSLAAWLG
jgi:hypothetical protein